jgi:hypothetical protein
VSLSIRQAVESVRESNAVPGYTFVTGAVTLVATLILLAGFDPIKVSVIALIFVAAALPLTFYPMLIVGARSPQGPGRDQSATLGCRAANPRALNEMAYRV